MSVTVAFVPLAPKAKIGSAGLKTAFAELWPHLPPPAVTKGDGGAIGIDLAGHGSVMSMVMPAPIPDPDLTAGVERAWLWPDAEAELAGHTAHLAVTTFAGPDDPVDRAKLLTYCVAAVLHACPQALGVYWGDAETVILGKLFVDMATKLLPDELPVYLWVNLMVGPGPKGVTGGATRGLAGLGHKEFETDSCPLPPGELRERLHDFTQYVLANGPVVRDGDTIGADERAEIRAKYAPSRFGAEGQVIRLDWVSAGKKRR